MTQVVIVVFDGLNTELVTPELMPNLHGFAQEGMRLTNHRPVFPSVTRLNAAAMVTGCFPGMHGLHGNLSLVREFDPLQPMDAMEPQLTALQQRGGKVLLVPTLADVLGEHGMEYIAAGVGTSGQAFMHHPNGDSAAFGATIHTDYALPRSLHADLEERFGAWPEKKLPNTARLRRVTDVFLEYVLGERKPAVSLLWFSEPDSSQHGAGIGSPTARESARDADEQFGRLLTWLAESGRGDDTNVIVTCDHGQATIIEPIPLADHLAAEGFPCPGDPGGIVVAANGSAALFYVQDHDQAITQRLAAWLMEQPWCGPILASEHAGSIEGTLPASLLGLEGPRTPDLLMSFAWRAGANERGAPGFVYAAGGAPGRGTHGSMSPWEFRTFTAMAGPAIRQGGVIETATGHPDLAPTVLRLLGMEVPPHMQGAPIEAALVGGTSTEAPPLEEHRASRKTISGTYEQRLTVAPRGGSAAYLVSAASTRVHQLEPAGGA